MTPILADLERVQKLIDEQMHKSEEIRSDLLELMLGLADLLERSVNHEYVDAELALARARAARDLAERVR